MTSLKLDIGNTKEIFSVDSETAFDLSFVEDGIFCGFFFTIYTKNNKKQTLPKIKKLRNKNIQ